MKSIMNPTRVLVVDDNEMFTEMAKFVLSAAGNVVETASDAGSALSTIPDFAPDLILMDIQMPEIDGIELTRRLKADRRRGTSSSSPSRPMLQRATNMA